MALLAGAWNLLHLKGTPAHRRVGWVYAVAMYMLVFTSLFIFEVFGRFGPFHVLALVSGVTLTLAVYFPIRRKHYRDWREHHYFWIAYSYVGLVMATGSHFFDYFPRWHYALRAGLFWIVPAVIGTILIFSRRRAALAAIQRLPAEERMHAVS